MIKLILKFMTSELVKSMDAIHILSTMSRNKGIQAMKFGQLV